MILTVHDTHKDRSPRNYIRNCNSHVNITRDVLMPHCISDHLLHQNLYQEIV
jgi:hypothetical protein